jgi:hypothetical protein
MPERTIFANARVIISEGEEDAAFARAMLQSHSDALPLFDVSPVIDIGKTGGSSGFGAAVMRADGLVGFHGVGDVVIIGDNDDDPAKAFDAIVRQVRKAQEEGNLSRKWAIPTVPFAKTAGDPSVSIWLWPSQGQPGCLETLLWQALQADNRHRTIIPCIDQAIQCAGIGGWPLSKLDKARVRCFIALALRQSPAVSVSRLWSHYPDLIRIRSAQFTPFLQFLRTI